MTSSVEESVQGSCKERFTAISPACSAPRPVSKSTSQISPRRGRFRSPDASRRSKKDPGGGDWSRRRHPRRPDLRRGTRRQALGRSVSDCRTGLISERCQHPQPQRDEVEPRLVPSQLAGREGDTGTHAPRRYPSTSAPHLLLSIRGLAARGASQTASRPGLFRQLCVDKSSKYPDIPPVCRLDLAKNPSASTRSTFATGC
jgi:hypothetical protein